MVIERGHDGIELRVELLRTMDGGLEDLARMGLTVCNERPET
jgi:hypothetical protein